VALSLPLARDFAHHRRGMNPKPDHRSETQRDPTGQTATTCPRCGESRELAKIKGCIVCLACGFKMDCNGW
jgi:hypothetical protein